MNKNISTQLQSTYKIALYSSLSLLISTPLIIFGRNIAALIIIGAILAIPAFYAAIIMWLHYARLIMCNKILSLITDKEMRDIKKISASINKPLVITRICTKYLVRNRYIIGYRINEYDNLEKISKRDRKLSNNTCPKCGAKLKLKNPDTYTCKYCGLEFEKK